MPAPPAEAAPELLPFLRDPDDREAVRFGATALTSRELARRAAAVAEHLVGLDRVCVWATASPHTCVAVVAALGAGVELVPINPRSGSREIDHVLRDCTPAAVLAATDDELPDALATLVRVDVDLGIDLTGADASPWPDEPPGEHTALIMYTSGTTGPPKGARLSRRAVAADLDGLAEAWDWRDDDVLVHALPLFHVHGLVLGMLGPLRRRTPLRHAGAFTPEAVAGELSGGATILFGVPTMYHRLAEAAEHDAAVAGALGGARLLVSGSAALPRSDHRRIEVATGRGVLERYGMTETLITCAVPFADGPRPGTVGPPLRGLELRVVDDDDRVLPDDGTTIGELQVRGPTVFDGYHGRPDATDAATTPDGWIRTGDIGTIAEDGYVTIVGRRSSDLIKSGGYKIGAGEIENALLDHPDVAEVAVTGEADPDLGERVVAWVVLRPGGAADADALAQHVAAELAPHKRPRVVHFVASLPRNEMGKVRKSELRAG
jgi:malonyl-CoA/methylmalonyl-CoA synthetase